MTMRIRQAAATLMLACTAWCAAANTANADSTLEYRVKAAFLYNFAKFVAWPDDAFESPDAPVVFCVVGRDPFGNSLESTVDGRRAGGREIRVRRGVRAAELGVCHMVFVSGAEADAVERILQDGTRPGLLTVGEGASFIESGGVISLVVDDGKVRFDVSTTAAVEADLKVSSQLLKLARTVKR